MTDIEDIDFKSLTDTGKKGQVFVISGPSGVGKGTLLTLLCDKHPDIILSVSVTTRKPREKEIEGKDYIFTTKEKFEEMIKKGDFLEWADFAGNYYGTCASTVEQALLANKNIALEIDVKGALQIKEKIKDAVLVFIMPPSMKELESRLFKRKTDSPEAIKKRLSIVKSEIEKKKEFNYEIINEDLDVAIHNLEAIVLAEKYKIWS